MFITNWAKKQHESKDVLGVVIGTKGDELSGKWKKL
jgi:hypothetical protein